MTCDTAALETKTVDPAVRVDVRPRSAERARHRSRSARAIKQRYAPMKGFKSIANASITIADIELAYRIHKDQFSFGQGRPRSERSLRPDWQRGLSK